MRRHAEKLRRGLTRPASSALVVAAVLLWAGRASGQIVRVQDVTGALENGTAVSATWPQATVAGRLLVASVGYTGGSAVTITPPGVGWTLIARNDHAAAIGTAVYCWQNAPAQSGTSTWTLSGINRDASLVLAEYDGLRASGALDVSASTQGTNGAISSPNVATTQTDELAIVLATVEGHGMTFGSPSGGFSMIDTVTAPGAGKPTSFLAERILSATATVGSSVSPSGGGRWTALVVTFKAAAKYWRPSTPAGATDGSAWADTSGGGATSMPGPSETIVFDGSGTGDCAVTSALGVRAIEIRAGFTGTITHAPGVTITLANGFSQAGGTYRNDGGTLLITGAGAITGGTFAVGAGVSRFTGGLTVASGAVLTLTGATGELAVGSGGVLAVNGTLSATAATAPVIDGISGTFAFSVGATAILDVTALSIKNTDAAGLTIANGATFTRFQGVRFQNNAGGSGSRHLQIAANALSLAMPGAYFDATAATNIRLVGNGDGDGTTRITVEDKGPGTSGALAGEAHDDDDDSAGTGTADHPTTNGAVVQWVRAAPADTAGVIVGFPSPAYDWGTFEWYATYAAYRDVAGAGTADRVYVRKQDGDAAYAYDLAQINGDLASMPLWDTVNELTSGVDANGDGDTADPAVHVVYLATTTGAVLKLVDTGAALVAPGAASPWSTAFSAAATASVTSPLVSDGNNIYFGGADGFGAPRLYGVQIAAGSSEKTLAKNVLVASPVRTAPALAILNARTYLFAGSTAVAGTAHLYRVDVATGLIDADYADATGDLSARVAVADGHVIVGDMAGRLHDVDGADFVAPLFQSVAGFPYADSGNHPTCSGVCGISAPAYVDMATGRIYFGDQDGHLYAITSTGAAVPGFPMRPTTGALSSGPVFSGGVLAVGTAAGGVLLIDESSATVLKTYQFGTTAAISTIAYDSDHNQYLLATDGGALYFLPGQSDPTP